MVNNSTGGNNPKRPTTPTQGNHPPSKKVRFTETTIHQQIIKQKRNEVTEKFITSGLLIQAAKNKNLQVLNTFANEIKAIGLPQNDEKDFIEKALNSKDSIGLTPLIYAIGKSPEALKMCQRLIELGADANRESSIPLTLDNQFTGSNITPLVVSVTERSTAIFDLLTTNGATMAPAIAQKLLKNIQKHYDDNAGDMDIIHRLLKIEKKLPESVEDKYKNALETLKSMPDNASVLNDKQIIVLLYLLREAPIDANEPLESLSGLSVVDHIIQKQQRLFGDTEPQAMDSSSTTERTTPTQDSFDLNVFLTNKTQTQRQLELLEKKLTPMLLEEKIKYIEKILSNTNKLLDKDSHYYNLYNSILNLFIKQDIPDNAIILLPNSKNMLKVPFHFLKRVTEESTELYPKDTDSDSTFNLKKFLTDPTKFQTQPELLEQHLQRLSLEHRIQFIENVLLKLKAKHIEGEFSDYDNASEIILKLLCNDKDIDDNTKILLPDPIFKGKKQAPVQVSEIRKELEYILNAQNALSEEEQLQQALALSLQNSKFSADALFIDGNAPKQLELLEQELKGMKSASKIEQIEGIFTHFKNKNNAQFNSNETWIELMRLFSKQEDINDHEKISLEIADSKQGTKLQLNFGQLKEFVDIFSEKDNITNILDHADFLIKNRWHSWRNNGVKKDAPHLNLTDKKIQEIFNTADNNLDEYQKTLKEKYSFEKYKSQNHVIVSEVINDQNKKAIEEFINSLKVEKLFIKILNHNDLHFSNFVIKKINDDKYKVIHIDSHFMDKEGDSGRAVYRATEMNKEETKQYLEDFIRSGSSIGNSSADNSNIEAYHTKLTSFFSDITGFKVSYDKITAIPENDADFIPYDQIQNACHQLVLMNPLKLFIENDAKKNAIANL